MDLTSYRNSAKEQERIDNLLSLIPKTGRTILDIGARDGYISKKLTENFETVVALDMQRPEIDFPNIVTVQGDVTSLDFVDDAFDCVLCSEVLEHIPPALLQKACEEIMRVALDYIIIGVPYEQENRIGRTTCSYCRGKNPPYGHINVFSVKHLENLFSKTKIKEMAFVGQEKKIRTNWLAVAFMDLSGNPFGTYRQEERCIYCNKPLIPPAGKRTLLKRVCSKMAWILIQLQNFYTKEELKPIWVHLVLSKKR